MKKFLWYAGVLLLVAATCQAGKLQSLTVTGNGLCGKDPITSKNGWIKLLNKRAAFDDQVEAPFKDNGTFTITLTVSRMFDFNPEIHIYTDCNDEKLGIPKPCQRKLVIKIPKKYVNEGTYNAGTLQLESKFEEESRDCSLKRSSTNG